ncbi:DUF5665 domain-containing protein [Peptococcus simiae]|uniref:DUF5665 domain-containing protein n=1 Tax=Peptococcus simiae TaxID=1643805 RepID=A0ABW9GWX3_9FIRM
MVFFGKKKDEESPDIRYQEARDELQNMVDDSGSNQEKFDKLIAAMDKARLAEYASYIAHPFRLLFMNFLIGLARGLGGTIGLALVLTIAGMILKNIITMNLPGISEWLAQLLSMVNSFE